MSAVCFFRELSPAQEPLAGGKGRTLARLAQADYPVPDGFVVLASAFEGDALPPAAWEQVVAGLARLRAGKPDRAFAVRSSGLSEDSAQASFAGEFETVLDVRDDAGIRSAIETVRRSRHAGRVAAYSSAQGLASRHEVAVVVQLLVPADFSGVLFTSDPVSGSHAAMAGNYVRGLGERLVSGETNAPAFTLRRPRGAYEGPEELRRFGRKLYRLAAKIERDFGVPQDIEWAITGGRIALLQARPITTFRNHDPATGDWNDSRLGDYLWTNANVGEAVPDVMTPCTWSLMRIFIFEVLPAMRIDGYSGFGNIGGRPYVNLSYLAGLVGAFGFNRKRFADAIEVVFGRIPEHMEIPRLPLSRWRMLRVLLPVAVHIRRRVQANLKRLDAFLAEAPRRCDAMRARIAAASNAQELIALWNNELSPHLLTCSQMLEAGSRRDGTPGVALRADLCKLVGEADANALIAGLTAGRQHLASLEPLLGLTQLARGEIDRATYALKYGHRGPHEFEVSMPRPAEDPDWIDRQLAGLREAALDVTKLLERQHQAHAAAFERFRQRYPRRAAAIRRRMDRSAAAARSRELTRSEVVRAQWPMRMFVLRAGALTGHGEALFFLTIEEILALLAGDASALAFVPARRATYERYRALPPYPAMIRGRFDPLQWAADPQRRSDFYDARGGASPTGNAITGFAGAAGVVEGRVRVLTRSEEGDQLQAGEILVTVATNVGWTPLFPRAAAVVTDVGAPLSHAAIVARELGIPAVVGCGNATMRLRTGDRVRVNGGQGTVEVLQAADATAA